MRNARMGRGWRFVALAGAAISLGAASNPQAQRADENQAEHKAPIPPPRPAYAPYPDWQREACYQAKDHDAADLCAQWRSAVAAEKAANATEIATEWSKAATALSGLALAALIWTLIQTENALWAAKRGNEISETTAKRELRAYLSVEPGGVHEAVDGINEVPIDLVNNGQTPAYDLEHGGDFLVITGDPRQFNPTTDGRLASLNPEDCVAETDSVLGPNTNRFIYAYIEESMTKPFWDKIHAKQAAIVHYGFFRYRDAFGEKHQTNFAFYHWGDDLTDLNSKRCRFGNSAD